MLLLKVLSILFLMFIYTRIAAIACLNLTEIIVVKSKKVSLSPIIRSGYLYSAARCCGSQHRIIVPTS